ncbi:MAG TPA: hypothetical protein DDW45_05500 [Gammaproteobacteria bacterium]|nr:hypothetical protein [Gammaproteobacteria bacterium]
MNKHYFQLRLNSTYESSKNKLQHLLVEHVVDGEWQPLVLSERSPGFLIYAYSIFTCQHLFMRNNCAERGIELASTSGEMVLVADEAWRLEQMHISFDAKPSRGTASEDDREYIISRMGQCPVSKNLPEIADVQTVLNFI